jgi:hypothetical protein
VVEFHLRETAAWVSAICAFGALAFTAYTAYQTNITRQLEIFDRAYRQIVRLEEKFLESAATGTTPEAALAWRAIFLNAMEYFAFLVNEGHVRDTKLRGYLGWPALHWYDTIFLPGASESELTDPQVYRELKRLVAFLRPR